MNLIFNYGLYVIGSAEEVEGQIAKHPSLNNLAKVVDDKLGMIRGCETPEGSVVVALSNFLPPTAERKYGKQDIRTYDLLQMEPEKLLPFVMRGDSAAYTRYLMSYAEQENQRFEEEERGEGSGVKIKNYKEEFLQGVGEYYSSATKKVAAENNKLVIGEIHQEKEATTYIKNLLPQLKQSQTPIFLEFLEWELWEPVLQRYYNPSLGSEEKLSLENDMKSMLACCGRGGEGNEDFFSLIKSARDNEVMVYAAETVVSYRGSNEGEMGAAKNVDKRLALSNYGTKKIIDAISPDKFIVLYGKDHLSKCDFTLQEMLGAKALSFSTRDQDFSQDDKCPNFRQAADVPEGFVSFSSDQDAVKTAVQGVMENVVQEVVQRVSASVQTASPSTSPARFSTTQVGGSSRHAGVGW